MKIKPGQRHKPEKEQVEKPPVVTPIVGEKIPEPVPLIVEPIEPNEPQEEQEQPVVP